MSFWQRKNEILGINARNLLYINRYNSKANKNFADNKIFTKSYLQSRGMGVARLYAVIRTYRELLHFDPAVLPDSFVIKPNRGFGGEGIIPVRSRRNNVYTSISGRRYRWEDLERECNAILEGKYAISGLHDQVIFEELLEAHPYFNDFLEVGGLPDLRIIVFNLVPVLAMLRLPTAESNGKANLHLGALGVGINIATGVGTYAVYRGKFIRLLPNGKPTTSIVIPNWQEVLLITSRVQQISKIGFLAVDIAYSKTGMKILELNARAGLNIQVANRVPLKSRLAKVADLAVSSPQAGVEIATTLFTLGGKRPQKKEPVKPIIGLYEPVEILNTDLKGITAKIDPHAKTNIFDDSLRPQLSESLADIKISGKRISVPFDYGNLSQHNYKIILAGKYLGDFLIDMKALPSRSSRPASKVGVPEGKEEKIIKNIDAKIFQIDRSLSVLTFFKPLNLLEEMKSFLANRSASPQFIYRKLPMDLAALKKEIKRIPQHADHPLMPLYALKIKELSAKVALLEARGTERIQPYSEKLYGRVSRELYAQAVASIKTAVVPEDPSEVVTFKKTQRTIEQFLADHKLRHWRLNIMENATVDMATNRRNVITLRKGVEFTANRLASLLTHEIETHVFRLENGRGQRYKIFEIGSAGYGTTEEGLAVYNSQLLHLPLGEKILWPAINVIAVYLARKLSFAELFQYLLATYQLSDEQAWKVCVKVKRGLWDTEQKAAFTKDILYYLGQAEIQEYVRQYGKAALAKLYVGKISISDLALITDVKLRPPQYLPALYKEFISKKSEV